MAKIILIDDDGLIYFPQTTFDNVFDPTTGYDIIKALGYKLDKSGGAVNGTINAANLQVGGANVYHVNRKPSAVDVGALAATNGSTDANGDGWIELPNGLIMQFGTTTVNLTSVNENYATVNFPKEFKDDKYKMVASCTSAYPVSARVLCNGNAYTGASGRVCCGVGIGAVTSIVTCSWVAVGVPK